MLCRHLPIELPCCLCSNEGGSSFLGNKLLFSNLYVRIVRATLNRGGGGSHIMYKPRIRAARLRADMLSLVLYSSSSIMTLRYQL